MTTYVLRLSRDHLESAARAALPAAARVLYLLDGAVTVDGRDLSGDSAWHGCAPCALVAGSAGATVLRYELVNKSVRAPDNVLLAHDIVLDPGGAYLMRCDRVDFDRGAEALPHRHQGGGIRCLVQGTLELRVEGQPDRVIGAGEAWFESGREAVYARASSTVPTSFIRCAILPRELRGRSSIVYVDPKDAASTPRRYTVYVDEPIELPDD